MQLSQLWRRISLPCFRTHIKANSLSIENKLNQNRNTVTMEKESKGETLTKRAQRRMKRRENERKRIAEKRQQHRITSMTNNSDILDDRNLQQTEYYFHNGLRKVYPYYFTFKTHTKGRWFGKTLVDIFTTEFPNSVQRVKKLVESGKMTVNGKNVSCDYKLKNGDFLEHCTHRHELPVTSEELEIIEDTDQILVVNKPSSIPIHPCGNYRFNSLTYILAKEKNYKNLRVIYRLDRLTSGVMILCKVEGLARTMTEHIKNRKVEKEYVCRVEGEFPSGIIECKEPIDVLSYKIGFYKVAKGGKEAHTTFERLSFNGTSSVVKCKPHTGRTHQIRVHLQYLGYPILNDQNYNGPVWGPVKGKGAEFGKSEEQLIKDLHRLHGREKFKVAPNQTEELENTFVACEKSTDTVVKPCSAEGNGVVVEIETKDSPNRTERSTDVSAQGPGDSAEKALDSLVSKELDSPEEFSGDCNTNDDEILIDIREKEMDGSKKSDAVTLKRSISSDNVEERASKALKFAGDMSNVENSGINREVMKVQGTSNEQVTGLNNIKCDNGSENEVKPECSEHYAFDPSKLVIDANCEECQNMSTFRDATPKEMIMYLHAYRYKGPDWDYCTPLPKWAAEDWKDDV